MPNVSKHLTRALFALPLFASHAALADDSSGRTEVLLPCGEATIETWIEGQGTTLVLLPSSGRDTYDFDEVARQLVARGYRVLRPQLRGTGLSTGPNQGVDLFDYADDVACAIRNTGTYPAVVVGHAFGNYVARAFAARYPSMTRGVVLAAAATKNIPPYLSANLERIQDPSTPPAVRRELIATTFFAPGNDSSVWWEGWYTTAARAQSDATDATPRDSWWPAGTARLLELHAESDPWMPAANRGDLRRELGARVDTVLIGQASHALFPEQPTEVARSIADWSDSLP